MEVKRSVLLILLLLIAYCGTAQAQPVSKSGVAFDYTRSGDTVDMYDISLAGAAWYYDYTNRLEPDRPIGVEYVQMIYRPSATANGNKNPPLKAAANPGSTWLLGNEPDLAVQANMTPAEYAEAYRAAYAAIKSADPTARIFAGGISTVSPLRLAWLDAMLAAYGEEFPADGWHIHPYILPEACYWGLGYPVGIQPDAAPARGCEYGDRHADYSAFVEQIDLFTNWMQGRGVDRPIIVSEYGVLLEQGHGYSQEVINDYMYGTFAYLDHNPRVERYAWFSVNYEWHPGALFDRNTKQLTASGAAYQRYSLR